MCGGTVILDRRSASSGGLSPRVRGNLIQLGEVWPKPSLSPRVRGNLIQLGEVWPKPGLSPRVRGNPSFSRSSLVGERSIPACAGNRAGRTVHASREGSIPACAGEPTKSWNRLPGARVYPRVCGGTSKKAAMDVSRKGLSPRVRENPLRGIRHPQRIGSIPACAGEPNFGESVQRCERVYPRVCGGTFSVNCRSIVKPGLSPRVRGNLDLDFLDQPDFGSIPACAGEPE